MFIIIVTRQVKKYMNYKLTLMEKSQGGHVWSITNTEKQRHVVHKNQVEMVLTTRPWEKSNNQLATIKDMTQKNAQQKQPQSNHLATIRGDFLGSISSNTGSRPGYCREGIAVSIHVTEKPISTKNECCYTRLNLFCNTLPYFSLNRGLHLVLCRHIFAWKSGEKN